MKYKRYSPFFDTVYDSLEFTIFSYYDRFSPLVHLDHDFGHKPFDVGELCEFRFAIFWDDDRDERIIGRAEVAYINNVLFPLAALAESQGVIYLYNADWNLCGINYEEKAHDAFAGCPHIGDKDIWDVEIKNMDDNSQVLAQYCAWDLGMVSVCIDKSIRLKPVHEYDVEPSVNHSHTTGRSQSRIIGGKSLRGSTGL